METVNNSDLLITVDLINVRKLKDEIVLETIFGQLKLKNYPDIQDLEDIMKLYKIPLINSKLEIEINKNYIKKLEIIRNEVIILIQNLLKITSLSQITWNDWVILEIFDKTNWINSGDFFLFVILNF